MNTIISPSARVFCAKVWAVFTVFSLVFGTGLFINLNSAQAADLTFTAEISPDTSVADATQSYEITLENTATHKNDDMKSIEISLPAGFSLETSSPAPSISDVEWEVCSTAGNKIIGKLVNPSTGAVEPGEEISFTFTATAPGSSGDHSFTVKAYKNVGCPGGGAEFNISGEQPAVTVSGEDGPGAETGTIIIKKQTTPEGAEATFDFTWNDGRSFELADGEEETFEDLDADETYTFTEAMPAGWELIDIVCESEMDNSDFATMVTDGVSITLPAGDTITCTFHNEKEEEIIDEEPIMCVEGEQWADELISFDQGTRKDESPVVEARSDGEAALGVAEETGAVGTFVSLGEGGSIVVKFNSYIVDGVGDDISIHETTNGSRLAYPLETALIEVSQDGVTWHSVGTADSLSAVTYFDISGTGLPWIQYVRVTDTTDFGPHADDADGFDLDGVDGVLGVCEEPEPLVCKEDSFLLVSSEETELEEGGFASFLSFIHSAWTAYLPHIGPVYTPPQPWIWEVDGVNDPTQDETVVFIENFWVGDIVSNATLNIASDNSHEAWINGVPVGADANLNNFQSGTQDQYDVTLNLIPGQVNELRISVTNSGVSGASETGNPAGLLYSLDVTSGSCNGVDEQPEDDNGDDDNGGNGEGDDDDDIEEEEEEDNGDSVPSHGSVISGGGIAGGGSVLGASFIPGGSVLGAATGPSCSPWLPSFIGTGANADWQLVLRLQIFLNTFEGESLVLNGVYDNATADAVGRFQLKYRDRILSPWGLRMPTRLVWLTTTNVINGIIDPRCEAPLPVGALAPLPGGFPSPATPATIFADGSFTPGDTSSWLLK